MRLSLFILCFCILVSCSRQPAPLDKSAYVGTYFYKSVDTSVDKPTDHELDRLVLEADGHYWLRQGGSTKAKMEKKGIWTLYPGEYPQISLDHDGYPIEIERGEIRLVINYDLGEWYVKIQ